MLSVKRFPKFRSLAFILSIFQPRMQHNSFTENSIYEGGLSLALAYFFFTGACLSSTFSKQFWKNCSLISCFNTIQLFLKSSFENLFRKALDNNSWSISFVCCFQNCDYHLMEVKVVLCCKLQYLFVKIRSLYRGLLSDLKQVGFFTRFLWS